MEQTGFTGFPVPGIFTGNHKMKISSILKIGFLSGVFGYFLYPYLALFNLYVSLETSDEEGVETRVDWTPFREGIEKDLDLFAKMSANRLWKEQQLKITWGSQTFSKEISEKVATPGGLIFLFHNPAWFFDQLKKIFRKSQEAAALNPPSEKTPYKPEGPNFKLLSERLQYAFFTGFSSFELRFKAGGLPYALVLELQGISWKMTQLHLPVESL